jgi:uncharacterized protein YneF (UPF0154 family)
VNKSLAVVAIIVSLLVGAVFGAGGMYYVKIVAPEKQLQKIAQEEKEKVDEMVRRGEITKITPDSIEIKVEAGGGDIGESISLRTNEYTTLQVGMGFVNESGGKADITEWFTEGDYVNVIASDGQALALHREARPGEVEEGEADEENTLEETDVFEGNL